MRVALVMVAVGDLSGSGGTERQFGDLHQYLRARNDGRVSLITACESLRRLREAGRLASDQAVVALPLGSRPGQGLIGVGWMTLMLLWATLGRGFDVVHICQPTPSYVPYAALMRWIPVSLRPRVAITVVDCTLAYNLQHGTAEDVYEQQVVDAHKMYFTWTKLDGVFSWYRAFVDLARAERLLPASTVLIPARYCFSDTVRFHPTTKTNLVVFAGRLSVQKRPLLFVDAVASVIRNHPAAAAAWHFEMYGGGPLEAEVRQRIASHGLTERLPLTRALDLSPVFGRSRLFVSTQAFENFTSQAMLEALSAGNAVIAENVGQTSEFVRDGVNGLLVSPATADAFANAIALYMQSPGQHDSMAAASRKIATEVHTIEHFAGDIESFWDRVVQGRAA